MVRSIGVIGTPGCGKTTLCSKLGLPVISLKDYAEENDCLGKIGEDGAAEMMSRSYPQFGKPGNTTNRWTSAHYIPVDALIVVRCDPDGCELDFAERDILRRKSALMLRLKC